MAEKTLSGGLGEGDGKNVKEEEEKKTRGRPKKIDKEKEKEEAKQMKDYLTKGSCGFTIDFGKNKRLERSPARSEQRRVAELKKEVKGRQAVEGSKKKTEIESSGREIQDEEGTQEKKKEELRREESTGKGKEQSEEEVIKEDSTVLTGGNRKDGKEDSEESEESTKGDSDDETGISRKEFAIVFKLVKNLENKIDRLVNEKKGVDRELAEVKEQLQKQIEEGKNLKKQMEKAREETAEVRERLVSLENLLNDVRGEKDSSIAVNGGIVNEVPAEEVREGGFEDKTESEQGVRRGEETVGDGKGRIQVERGYLKTKPDRLSREEIEWEMAERRSRKKNIFISGIRMVGAKIKEEIKGIIKENLGETIYIKRTRAIGGGIVAELESMENKLDIMRKKGLLKGINLWIEDDITDRERVVQNWLNQ